MYKGCSCTKASWETSIWIGIILRCKFGHYVPASNKDGAHLLDQRSLQKSELQVGHPPEDTFPKSLGTCLT